MPIIAFLFCLIIIIILLSFILLFPHSLFSVYRVVECCYPTRSPDFKYFTHPSINTVVNLNRAHSTCPSFKLQPQFSVLFSGFLYFSKHPDISIIWHNFVSLSPNTKFNQCFDHFICLNAGYFKSSLALQVLLTASAR